MNDYLVESVPNISEGRDQNVINQLVESIAQRDVKILNVDSGYDANRTVMTIVGPVSPMMDAIKKMYFTAAEVIYMTRHTGAHPRIGAIDVCPFIPFDESHKEDLKNRVELLAKEISDEIRAPIFLYKDSSKGGIIKSLPSIRKGEYEMLTTQPQKMKYQADYGWEFKNSSFGGSVIGVRDFMIAYNINLNTSDLSLAQQVASEMRKVRREIGQYNGKNIKPLQILGWYMDEYHCCQISTNIHNPRELSMRDVFDFTHEVAQDHGLSAVSSELVGMIPEFALDQCKTKGDSDQDVINALGLDFNGTINRTDKVLERRIDSLI